MYYKVCVGKSANPQKNADGGDYDDFIVLEVSGNNVLRAGYTGSSIFEMCAGCGYFNRNCSCTQFRGTESVFYGAEYVEQYPPDACVDWLLPTEKPMRFDFSRARCSSKAYEFVYGAYMRP